MKDTSLFGESEYAALIPVFFHAGPQLTLGQLWPFCPVCVSMFLASVPACHVLEIKYAVLSLVRPAKKGACVL